MEALQYIYTSWKNGDSTEKGYMIYSRSEGISESECTAIKDAMQYLARQAVIQDVPSSRCDYLFDEVRRKEGFVEKLGGFFHKK